MLVPRPSIAKTKQRIFGVRLKFKLQLDQDLAARPPGADARDLGVLVEELSQRPDVEELHRLVQRLVQQVGIEFDTME